MGSVWKRPGLLALELLWRWSAGIPVLFFAFRAVRNFHPDLAPLESITFLKPAQAIATIHDQLAQLLLVARPAFAWFIPLALSLWTTASALGRSSIYRRLDPALRPSPLVLATVGLTRTLTLLLTVAVWVRGLGASARYAITTPAATGAEPNVVLFAALAVSLTLLLFMAWSLTVWLLDAAPLYAMVQGKSLAGSLRAALHSGPLRSKLIELNLVMAIVKVCLLVLAMVASASPIPFESVEGPAFLAFWWAFTATLYLIASDLFHVIRRAACLALFRALTPALNDTTPATAPAS